MEREATVNDVIEMLQKVKDQGKGEYRVTCNLEYTVLKNDDLHYCSIKQIVDLEGWC